MAARTTDCLRCCKQVTHRGGVNLRRAVERVGRERTVVGFVQLRSRANQFLAVPSKILLYPYCDTVNSCQKSSFAWNIAAMYSETNCANFNRTEEVLQSTQKPKPDDRVTPKNFKAPVQNFDRVYTVYPQSTLVYLSKSRVLDFCPSC